MEPEERDAASTEHLEVCERAARAGGATLLDWIGRFEAREKAPADLVTEADLASQQAIRRIVLDAFPEHELLGEEEDPTAPPQRETAYRWIADPLDGTANYVHQVPHYCVSLALERCATAERPAELLVGVVFDPVSGECYSAAAGRGAWLNGAAIRSSDVSELSGSLAAVGFPPGSRRDGPDVDVFLAALESCQAIRRTGSAALNMCYVAAGRFDVFWSYSTKVWDMAAGALLIEEAGGAIVAPDGGPLRHETGQFLAAANEPLLGKLQEMVARAGR